MSTYASECRQANEWAARLRGSTAPKKPATGGAKAATAPSVTQADVLAFMRAYFADNDQLPPTNSVAEYFGWQDNGAHWHIKQLEKFDHIEKNANGKYRFARGK